MPGPFIHNIDPIFGQIGGLYLWWYGLSYTLGFLTLFRWLRSVREPLGINVSQVYDLSILVAFGVLAGGRLVEVIFYEWAYYGSNLSHIAWLWLGGMSTHGILLGGTLGLLVFSRINRISFLQLADEMVIPAAMIMGLGRIGNFIDGQIVGSVTDVWWAVEFPDAEGFRHPVVLYDGLKNLALIPILLVIRNHSPARGVLLGCFLFGYGFFRFLLDFFREYRTDLFGLPPGQEFNIAMSVFGAALVIWAIRKRNAIVTPVTRKNITSGASMDVRKATKTRRLAFQALLIIPLFIPSDWTQDVPGRYGGRHPGMVHTTLYPEIIDPLQTQ